MRFTVIVANSNHLNSAGVRIRYERIREPLKALGYTLDFKIPEEIKPEESTQNDFYLFCKCVDIRSIRLADALGSSPCKTGIDLFDDYFSQINDSRIVHMRRWFSDILERIDFITCATPTMATRLRDMGVTHPIHVINDPFDNWDPAAVTGQISENLTKVHQDKKLRVGWFGIGDNGFFPVGLDDLTAFSDKLSKLRRTGLDVDLQILTNVRALTPDMLARLSRLPVPHTITEWTIERESALLKDCFLAFIPVNAQPFSSVKSLNRAITALTQGAQVLTAGYPLYRPLNDYIYTSPHELLADLHASDMRFSSKTIATFDSALKDFADPARESEALAGFLSSLPTAQPMAKSRKADAVLHGFNSPKFIHKYANLHAQYSIASPYMALWKKMDFGVTREQETGAPVLYVSKSVISKLSQTVQDSLESVVTEDGNTINALRLPKRFNYVDAPQKSARRLAHYGAIMRDYADILQEILPDLSFYLSEAHSPLTISDVPGGSDLAALNRQTSEVPARD
jgi:hypothetical protein